MPRSKENKKRPQPSSEVLAAAVNDILKNNISLRAAEDKYNISKSALGQHVAAFKKSELETFTYTPHYDRNRVFSTEQETLLVEYLEQCSFLHYGLTLIDLRKLAFQFAKENGIDYPTNWDNNHCAGEGWARCFRSRHTKELALRKPEPTSLSRATSFNKENVAKFFNNYSNVLSRHNFDPAKIYNVDETGISTVHNPPKIIAQKGVKAVGGMTSGERGVNITMIAAINAIGNSVPPMFVFPRVNFKDHMLKGAPPGSKGAAASSGWSNEQIFLQFLHHFINHTKPSLEDPIIMVLDNHESHISVPAISLAKKVGLIMVTFHPHTSHKMQPLDRTVFGPFKTFFSKAVADWMITPGNQGKPVTIYDMAELAGKAYAQAFTPSNIVKGFQVSGLYPLNKYIFQDDEFLPSNVTDRPDPAETEQGQRTNNIQLIDQPDSQLSTSNQPSTSNQSSASNQPSTSNQSSTFNQPSTSKQPSTPNEKQDSIRSTYFNPTIVTPEEIRPFPKAAARKENRKCRAKGKSRILTDTPEKNEIESAKKHKLQYKVSQPKKRKVRLNLSKFKGFKQSTSPVSSSSESADMMDLCEEKNDSFSEEEESYIFAKDLESKFSMNDLRVNDYILVKFPGKKSVKYYVAQVVEIEDQQHSDIFIVKYLKKCLDSNKFKIEKDAKLYEVSGEDIIIKLPDPVTVGGTERRENQLTFHVSFAGFLLG